MRHVSEHEEKSKKRLDERSPSLTNKGKQTRFRNQARKEERHCCALSFPMAVIHYYNTVRPFAVFSPDGWRKQIPYSIQLK